MTDSSIARDRYLLLDNRLIEKTENAKLTVGTVKKHKANPLFVEDKPWEKRFDNLYGNVLYDKEEKIYKCWYSPFIVDNSAKGMSLEERDSTTYRPPRGKREMGICYATSKDGIKWKKPNLNQVEYEGSKENNIVWRRPHGAGVFKDCRDPDPKRRYKMLMMGLATAYSADGIKWHGGKKIHTIGEIAGDTHNNMFWDENSKKYVGITRTWGKLGREVTRIESSDFETWMSNGVILESLEKNLQPYAMPVFIYADIYIALVAIHAQPQVDRVWTELAWSPDSKKWYRIDPGKPLIPCSEKKLEYDYGCVYPCAYPIFKDDEIQFYYGGGDYLHHGWREGSLCLATLRPDGFAGYEQEFEIKAAVITTKAFPYAGENIRLTADVFDNGRVRVIVADSKDNPVTKFQAVTKTVTDKVLKFSEKCKADKIKLLFEVTNAKVYSFSFEKK